MRRHQTPALCATPGQYLTHAVLVGAISGHSWHKFERLGAYASCWAQASIQELLRQHIEASENIARWALVVCGCTETWPALEQPIGKEIWKNRSEVMEVKETEDERISRLIAESDELKGLAEDLDSQVDPRARELLEHAREKYEEAMQLKERQLEQPD